MRKFLRKWLFKEDYNVKAGLSPVDSISDNRARIRSTGLSVNIIGGTGGHVVEFNHYDVGTDRISYKMYIIPNDKDFTEEFAKCVKLEMIR